VAGGSKAHGRQGSREGHPGARHTEAADSRYCRVYQLQVSTRSAGMMLVSIVSVRQSFNPDALLSDLRALFDTYLFVFENQGIELVRMPLYIMETEGGIGGPSQLETIRLQIDCEPQGPNTILEKLPGEPRPLARWPFTVEKPVTLRFQFTLDNGNWVYHIHEFVPGVEYLEHFNGGANEFLNRLVLQ
jgi:hypothetical protein